MLTKRGSEDLQDLILRLLQGIPQKRLSAEQALLEIGNSGDREKNHVNYFPVGEKMASIVVIV